MERKKLSRPAWIASMLILLPLLYVLSFGPACWWFSEVRPSRVGRSGPVIVLSGYGPHLSRIYWPLGWLASEGPEPLSRAVIWYAMVGTRSPIVVLPTSPFGEAWYRAQRPRRSSLRSRAI